MRTLSTKQKPAISICFKWCDAKWILAFSKFLKQKTFSVAIKWFSDSSIWCPSAGTTTANNNNIHKWGDVVASLWEFSPFGFVSVLLDLELNRMPQITNPPNGTPVAFLWELNADSTKLCLIGLRVSSANRIKILTSSFYILPN